MIKALTLGLGMMSLPASTSVGVAVPVDASATRLINNSYIDGAATGPVNLVDLSVDAHSGYTIFGGFNGFIYKVGDAPITGGNETGYVYHTSMTITRDQVYHSLINQGNSSPFRDQVMSSIQDPLMSWLSTSIIAKGLTAHDRETSKAGILNYKNMHLTFNEKDGDKTTSTKYVLKDKTLNFGAVDGGRGTTVLYAVNQLAGGSAKYGYQGLEYDVNNAPQFHYNNLTSIVLDFDFYLSEAGADVHLPADFAATSFQFETASVLISGKNFANQNYPYHFPVHLEPNQIVRFDNYDLSTYQKLKAIQEVYDLKDDSGKTTEEIYDFDNPIIGDFGIHTPGSLIIEHSDLNKTLTIKNVSGKPLDLINIKHIIQGFGV